jgi:putative oxidoreductase
MPIDVVVRKTRERLLVLIGKLSFLAPALIRLTLGVVFLQSGWGKLQTLDKVTEYFTSLGIPMPGFNARLASSTEFFGGILLLVGLGTRLAALPMGFTMVIAMITAKREEYDGPLSVLGFSEWAYLVMFLVLALIGPGALSLDALIARRFSRPVQPMPQPMIARAEAAGPSSASR